MKKISNKIDDKERAFFGLFETEFDNIKIDGPADGESAFKECKKIVINNSYFNLRYPMWHVTDLKVKNSVLTNTCRAAFWYCKNVSIKDVKSEGIKGIRECKKVSMENSDFLSDEIFWRVNNIKVYNSKIEGVYGFFQSENIDVDKLIFKGKYSFQYVKNVTITNSILDTKDAFWHSENVTCINCVIKGEYLGWYAKKLTLIDCEISGTQPLCYVNDLKMINCKCIDCDLSFEYSSVNGNILGDVVSIKNPLSGVLKISGKTTYIKDENDRSRGKFKLIQ